MGGWFQLDWFGGDWDASYWEGADDATNSGSVTFSAPSLAGVGTVGSSAITGTGTITISAPEPDAYGYRHRRGGGKKRKAVDQGLLLLELWSKQEDEVILSSIQSFVQLEEEAWELSPIA